MENPKPQTPPIIPNTKTNLLINLVFYVIDYAYTLSYIITGKKNYRDVPAILPIIFKNTANLGIKKADQQIIIVIKNLHQNYLNLHNFSPLLIYFFNFL